METNQKKAARLTEYLSDCSLFSRAEWHTCLSSTNDRACQLAREGAPEGTVVIAGQQTAGRGRMGRRFYSPSGCGLYFSMVLKPVQQAEDTGLLTACAAVAVYRAVRQITGAEADIKWVNDLYYGGKKLCGILAEGQLASTGSFAYLILGIGINVYPPAEGYADEISRMAISLSEISPQTSPDDVALCAAVIRSFADFYEKLPQTDFLDTYRKASCVLGEKIRYEKAGQTYYARALAIDDKARLVIENEQGKRETLCSGEVSLLRRAL